MYTYLSSNQNWNSATMKDIKLVVRQIFKLYFSSSTPH